MIQITEGEIPVIQIKTKKEGISAALLEFAGCYIVRIDGDEDVVLTDPEEATARLMGTVECQIKQRIGDMREKKGLNRHTWRGLTSSSI